MDQTSPSSTTSQNIFNDAIWADINALHRWADPIRKNIVNITSRPQVGAEKQLILQFYISVSGILVDYAHTTRRFNQKQWSMDKSIQNIFNIPRSIVEYRRINTSVSRRERLACGKCKTNLKKLYAIPCGHSFCNNCAKQILTKSCQQECCVCSYRVLCFATMYY